MNKLNKNLKDQSIVQFNSHNQNKNLQTSASLNELQNNQANLNKSEKPSQNNINSKPIQSESGQHNWIQQDLKNFLKKKRAVQSKISDENIVSLPKLKKTAKVNPIQPSSQANHTLSTNRNIQTQTKLKKDHPSVKNRQKPLIKCPICQGSIEEKMIENKTFQCNHSFCFDCTKTYISYKIKLFEEVYCLKEECKALLNDKTQFYSNQFSLKQRKQYAKIHRFFEINKSEKPQKLCPKQDCDGIIGINENNKEVLKCQRCQTQFCPKCLSSLHQGKCEDFQTTFMRQSLNLVECQKCKNFIEKYQGCHHISCKCGYEFCQKCKKPWSKPHTCKYAGMKKAIEGWGGCDWGLTTKDHIYFLLKLPLKFLLIILCATLWFTISFLAAPLNLLYFSYWLYLLIIKPTVETFLHEESWIKIFLYLLFLPLVVVVKLYEGPKYLVEHLDSFLPQIPNSFRSIIRI